MDKETAIKHQVEKGYKECSIPYASTAKPEPELVVGPAVPLNSEDSPGDKDTQQAQDEAAERE